MPSIKKSLIALVMWVALAPLASAITLTSTSAIIKLNASEDLSLLTTPLEVVSFAAEGSIYMEYGYFLAHVGEGLAFEAEDSVSFLVELDDAALPVFEDYNSDLGVAWSAEGDAWITATSALSVHRFAAGESIYVLDRTRPTNVPVPGAAMFLVSGLVSLVGLRRLHRSV